MVTKQPINANSVIVTAPSVLTKPKMIVLLANLASKSVAILAKPPVLMDMESTMTNLGSASNATKHVEYAPLSTPTAPAAEWEEPIRHFFITIAQLIQNA